MQTRTQVITFATGAFFGMAQFLLPTSSQGQSTSTTSECTATYHAFGGQTDTGERVRPEDLEGATLYFLDIDNWPGQEKLSSLSFAGGGIVSKGQFRDGKAAVKFPEGRHKVTVVVVQQGKRYWVYHDRKALPFYEKPPLHEFYCASGKIGPRR